LTISAFSLWPSQVTQTSLDDLSATDEGRHLRFTLAQHKHWQQIIGDVYLTMSTEILKRTDYDNQNYIHKKAIYLMHIAMKLKEKGTLVGKIKVVDWKHDPLKPVITIKAEDCNIVVNAIAGENSSY
jgi:Nrap protein domain 1